MLSKTNVKYIQSLRHKKLREEVKSFIAEGPKVVEEFLSSGTFECEKICALERWFTANHELVEKILQENRLVVDENELAGISQLKSPNQVLAVFHYRVVSEVILKNAVTLLLDDIHDPGNMGTLIRIADWFNIKNVVCSESCVDCYNPKVVQASMGSLSRVNILYTHLEQFINTHRDIKVYAATLSGEDVSSFQKIKEGMLLIGNESTGIKKELLNLAHERVTIPKSGKADSLNAAVAAGIILSHIV